MYLREKSIYCVAFMFRSKTYVPCMKYRAQISEVPSGFTLPSLKLHAVLALKYIFRKKQHYSDIVRRSPITYSQRNKPVLIPEI